MGVTAEYLPAQAGRHEAGTLSAWLGYIFFWSISVPWLVELPGSVTVAQLFMLLFLPVWATAFLAGRSVPFDRVARRGTALILGVCGVFVFLSLLSGFVADTPFRAMRAVVSFLTGFAIFALVAGTVTDARLDRYFDVLTGSLILVCVATVAGFVEPTLNAMIFGGNDRASGFFKNSNQFGIAISTVLPVAFALVFARRAQVLRAVGVLVLLLGLIASGSKTNLLISVGTLSALIVLFCIVAFTGRTRVFMLLLALIGTVLFITLGLLALSILNPRALLLLQIFFSGEDPHSIVSRAVLWEQSIDLFLAHPVLGVGAGQPLPDIAHSHNVILEYARTLGVPGLVLIVVLLGAMLAVSLGTGLRALRASAAPTSVRILCLGCAFSTPAYIAANLTSDSFGPTTSPFLFSVFFLGLACRRQLGGER